MSDERLVSAAREVLRLASDRVKLSRHDFEDVVIVPANALTWLENAMTPEQRYPAPFVSIDPSMRSGQPCINGSRLPVSTVAEQMWHLGLAEIQLSWDYLRRADVLVACWYQGEYGGRTWRKRWGRWAKAVASDLWHCTTVDYETVPLPPTRQEAGRD